MLELTERVTVQIVGRVQVASGPLFTHGEYVSVPRATAEDWIASGVAIPVVTAAVESAPMHRMVTAPTKKKAGPQSK